MKKVFVNVFCAVAVVFAALSAFASAQVEVKNDCLLYGRNCPHVVDSLPQRIEKLKIEITKGERVYTPDELKLLKRRLKEDHESIRVLNKPGGNR